MQWVQNKKIYFKIKKYYEKSFELVEVWYLRKKELNKKSKIPFQKSKKFSKLINI